MLDDDLDILDSKEFCRECFLPLIKGDNWSEGKAKAKNYICDYCFREEKMRQRKANPWKYKLKALRGSLKTRGLPDAEVTEWELREIYEEQRGLCVFCGEWLDPCSSNCHLDHIVPTSAGGLTEKDNIQFLCEKCSYGKWKFSSEEYVRHCQRVAKWYSK